VNAIHAGDSGRALVERAHSRVAGPTRVKSCAPSTAHSRQELCTERAVHTGGARTLASGRAHSRQVLCTEHSPLASRAVHQASCAHYRQELCTEQTIIFIDGKPLGTRHEGAPPQHYGGGWWEGGRQQRAPRAPPPNDRSKPAAGWRPWAEAVAREVRSNEMEIISSAGQLVKDSKPS